MDTSDISFIPDGPEDPIELFNEWYREVIESGHTKPGVLCLATSSRDGSVNARHLLLRRVEKDGIIILSDRGSMKSKEMAENPQAAVAIFWEYCKDGNIINRQVRMKVSVREMAPEEYESLYNAEPLFCKLRAHVCHQGEPADWQQLKDLHDKLKGEYESGTNNLAMPSHYVGYKLTPTLYDFYHAVGFQIADRLGYKKEGDQWIQHKITA